MSSHWISRKETDKQYRPKGYGLSPGLQRARAPFRTRNTITGLAIGAFVVGVWAYSISAVKQDTFEDLDEEAKELLAARMADERIRGQTTAETTNLSSSNTAGTSKK
ncbi:hypothetical protein ACEPAF_6591 [Sanghuangporus sanghuang]